MNDQNYMAGDQKVCGLGVGGVRQILHKKRPKHILKLDASSGLIFSSTHQQNVHMDRE
jgi:hypothetical protein